MDENIYLYIITTTTGSNEYHPQSDGCPGVAIGEMDFS